LFGVWSAAIARPYILKSITPCSGFRRPRVRRRQYSALAKIRGPRRPQAHSLTSCFLAGSSAASAGKKGSRVAAVPRPSPTPPSPPAYGFNGAPILCALFWARQKSACRYSRRRFWLAGHPAPIVGGGGGVGGWGGGGPAPASAGLCPAGRLGPVAAGNISSLLLAIDALVWANWLSERQILIWRNGNDSDSGRFPPRVFGGAIPPSSTPFCSVSARRVHHRRLPGAINLVSKAPW